jgi:hypothetical protein
MTSFTDPARELADLCQRLNQPSAANTHAFNFLATQLEVPAWSAQFFALIFAIAQRIEDLKDIVETLEMDDDIRRETLTDLDAIKSAFSPNGLSNTWNNAMQNCLSPAQVKPLRTLSQQVRGKYPVPRLSADERETLLADVDQLLEWLREHQLVEQDFIRQALIDGLTQFRHRLERLEWVGWGYTLQSMRDVIGAYLALERGLPPQDQEPAATAILRRRRALSVGPVGHDRALQNRAARRSPGGKG